MVLLKLQGRIMLIGQLLLFSNFISGCLGTPPCEGGGLNNCEGVNLGILSIDSIVRGKIPSEFANIVDFKNSNGFLTSFSTNGIKKVYFRRQDLLHKSEQGECRLLFCYDYIATPVERLTYKSSNTSFNYEYSLNSVSTTKSEEFVKDRLIKGYSVASIIVNSNEFKLPFNVGDYNNWLLVDSIKINNKYYNSVYHIYLDSTLIDKTVIKPQGIYYKRDIGLIAFYLTNGETWGLK
jgi:hypothetical protein